MTIAVGVVYHSGSGHFCSGFDHSANPRVFFWDLAAEIWGQNHALSVAFADYVREQFDLMKQWLKYKKCHPEGGLSVDEGVNLVGNRLSKLG
jgi:hypothetical protein